MYAVIETGSKQYKVSQGDIIEVELLGEQPEAAVKFDKVLLLASDDKIEVGTPYVAGAKVSGKVIKDFQSDKVTTFKYKNKINYHRTKGHRQRLTQVEIQEVSF